MELSEQDRQVLKFAAEQLWRKGCVNPAEATVAQAFTDLVNRAIALSKPKESKEG